MAGRTSKLAILIEDETEAIARRFAKRARQAGAAEALPDEQVIDGLRAFLRELVAAVRAEYAEERAVATSPSASHHGEQRFRLGYDLAGLVREYGALSDVLWEVIGQAEFRPEHDELRILFKYLTSGIADAAAQYGSSRDAELRARTAQHVGFLAHELRNPLSSARMALALIEERGEIQPSRARDALERSLVRVNRRIDDALVSVRLDDLDALDPRPLDVASLLADVARDSMTDAEAKGVEVRAEGSGTVRADERALRSAISNLIRNAVKFTHSGGKILARAREADSRVIIEVEDECGGLPEGRVQKLFDPFVQAGADRSGFGLGLAIAKQAAEAHGGQIRVHDLPGKGCVFVLDLPMT